MRVTARYEAMVKKHAQRMEALQRTVSDFQREQHLVAARDLTIDTFDSSLDRVSEGDLRAGVEGLNSSIDEFVMNLIDSVSTKPTNPDLAKAKTSKSSLIYSALSGLGVEDDRRGLLLEADLHDGLTQKIHARFFKGSLGVSLTRPMNTNNLEIFYTNAIVGKGAILFSVAIR
jgi:hypothetical protein